MTVNILDEVDEWISHTSHSLGRGTRPIEKKGFGCLVVSMVVVVSHLRYNHNGENFFVEDTVFGLYFVGLRVTVTTFFVSPVFTEKSVLI